MWQWIVAAALLVALWGVALFELRAVFATGGWLVAALMMVTVMLGVAAQRRVSGRSADLPHSKMRLRSTLFGVAAGFAVWIVSFGLRGRLSAWWADPAAEALEVSVRIESGVAPLKVAGALEDALLLAVLLVAAATVYFFARGWLLGSGILIALVLLLPVVVTGFRLPITPVLVSGLLLALLVWAGSPKPNPVGLISASLVLVVTAGIFQLTPNVRDRAWNQAVLFAPVSVTVPDVTVALAEDLRRHSDTVAFKAMGLPPGMQRFTLATLVDFEDGKWMPQFALNGAGDSVSVTRWPWGLEPIASPTDGGSESLNATIIIEGLRSTWLPVPTSTSRVQGVGHFDENDWIWIEGSPTARSETSITRDGDQYRVARMEPWTQVPVVINRGDGSVEIEVPEFTAGIYSDGDSIPTELAPFLALPEGMPDEMREVARAVAARADNGLGKAALLEEYFISGQFAYDESAPYTPGADPDDPYSVMTAFLEQRSGFCVHYASTFAVLARELGIPTRLSVGYAANIGPTENGAEVRGTDLHAWPEIFIEELGWIAFEPTPGGAGRVTERNNEDAEVHEAKREETQRATPGVTTEETPIEEPEGESGESKAQASDDGTWSMGLIGGLVGAVLLLMLAAPATVRLVRSKTRVRRIALGAQPAQQAWAEVVDTAVDLGLLTRSTPLRARTPDALIEHLSDRGSLATEATEAMRTLAGLMEAERYSGRAASQTPRDPQPDDSTEPIVACLATVRRGLKLQASKSQRVAAKLMPRSVLSKRSM